MDFFKYRNIAEEGGAGDEGTPSLVAKYKNATPGQTSPAPSRQPARKGDKLNAKMDYSTKIKQDDIEVKNTMEAFEDPEAQKSEMALTKLHFIKYAADEIKQYIEMGAPIEEWYQIKLAKVHADMEGLHSYMEGEKRRTGMVGEAASPMIAPPKTGKEFGTKADAFAYVKKHGGKVMKKSFINPRTGQKFISYIIKEEAIDEGENKQMKGKDPCWKGYQMVGTKKKGGKEVPDCKPTNEAKMDNSEILKAAKSLASNGKDEKTKSFGKGLVDFYNKNGSFTPDQVSGLQNIMKNASFQMAKEGVMKNIKRQLTARDADSRAGEEAGKMMKAQQAGDTATATKHNKRFKRLQALTKKEGYASAAQRKAVWASKNEKGIKEKLDPSMGAGEYVKDFQKSDAPQFKGKSKKERQKMAVAAYLSAKRGD